MGDESELNYLIQSGDVSRALQLTAAAISVVDVTALAKKTESQAHELTEKRILVKIYYHGLLIVKCLLQEIRMYKVSVIYISDGLKSGHPCQPRLDFCFQTGRARLKNTSLTHCHFPLIF